MIVSDQTGIPVERITPRRRRHRPRATRRRHGRVAVAAARRHRRCIGATEALVDKAKHLAAHLLEADVGRHRRRHDDRHGRRRRRARPRRSTGPRSPPRPRRRRRVDHADGTLGLAAELDFHQGGADVPVRRAHRRRRGRPRHGQGARCCATSPSTTAAPCSTRCSSRASSTAGVAAGVGQALYEQVVYDDDGNPLTGNFVDYAIPSAAEFPSFEVAPHRDADAAQPARRQGHRRGRHDRLHAGGAERGRSTRSATSACATSTCRARPSGCGATIRAAEAGDPARPVARAAGGLRRARAPPGVTRRTPTSPASTTPPGLTPMAHDPATAAMKAKVLTVSDGVVHGTREDRSGAPSWSSSPAPATRWSSTWCRRRRRLRRRDAGAR